MENSIVGSIYWTFNSTRPWEVPYAVKIISKDIRFSLKQNRNIYTYEIVDNEFNSGNLYIEESHLLDKTSAFTKWYNNYLPYYNKRYEGLSQLMKDLENTRLRLEKLFQSVVNPIEEIP